MALTQCAECGNDVSDKASACPHCGAPVPITTGNEFRLSTLQEEPPNRKPSWILLGGGIVLIALVFVFFIKPRFFPSAEQIGETAQKLIQQKFDTDSNFQQLGLKVERVTAISQGGSNYQGIATIVYEGESHEVPVEIVANSDGIMWKMEPGALMFVAQREFQKAFANR